MLVESAKVSGRGFQVLAPRIVKGKRLSVRAVLHVEAGGSGGLLRTFRRPSGRWHDRPLLAFQASGASLASQGFRPGDFLLVEPAGDVKVGQTVLAEIDGTLAVQRVRDGNGGHLRLQSDANDAPSIPLVMDGVRVHGVVRGIVGRRGFAKTPRKGGPQTRMPAERTDVPQLALLPQTPSMTVASKLRMLGSRLFALRKTYLSTTNPRLRHALLNEGKRLRRELARLESCYRRSPQMN